MNDSIGKRIINVLLVCLVILFVVALFMYFGLYRDQAIADGKLVAESWKGYGAGYWFAKETADQIAAKRHAWLIAAIASPVAFAVLLYIRGAYTKQPPTDTKNDINN